MNKKQFRNKLALVNEERTKQLSEGVISFFLTKKVVDRDSEVILPKGAVLRNFKRNPVFLWMHGLGRGGMMDHGRPPIGRVIPESIEVTDDYVAADVQFDMDDPFAQMIYGKFKKGFLNAGSIRFMPIEISDQQVLPGQKRWTIKKWELLEFSAVSVPANQEALRREFDGKELKCDDQKCWVEDLNKFYDDDEFDSYEKTPEGLVQYYNDQEDDLEPEEVVTITHAIEPTHLANRIVAMEDDNSEPFDHEKPYPNEHACRLKDPGQYVRFRRQSRSHNGKAYSVIIGFKQGGGSEDQAYRYPKATWTVAQARAHCKSHDGQQFEPATGTRGVPLDLESTYAILEASGRGYEPFRQHVLAPSDEEFDEVAVVEALSEDHLTLRQASAWHEVGRADETTAFKFIHHSVDADGDLRTNFLGVARAMIKLLRGEVDVGDEKKAVYAHLARHYREFDKEPPPLKDYDKDETIIDLPQKHDGEILLYGEEDVYNILKEVAKIAGEGPEEKTEQPQDAEVS